MPRLSRLFVPGLPAHLIVRGNNRQDIFLCDGDRRYFLQCLVDAATRSRMAIHAYVLMTNHVHLLATGETADSFPKTFQSVGRRFVAYFNARHHRTGTLWEGRYRSTVVQADAYLLTCHRYIDMNPVRAGLVSLPVDYPWSSHRHYSLGQRDDLVTPHCLTQGMSGSGPGRRAAYAAMFEDPLSAEALERIRYCLNNAWALGTPSFCHSVGGQAGRRASPLGRGWPKGKKRGAPPGANEGV